MKIGIISGSNRTGRKSHLVAQYLQQLADGHKAVTESVLLDIRAYNFPVLEERYGRLANPPEGLEEFHQHLISSDALIIVTPEYNGGMAGSLKNTLDYFRSEFERKPMTAVTVSSGSFGGTNALHQLWFWMLYVSAIVSPTKLLVSHVNEAFDEAGRVVDERLQRNGVKAVDDLMWLTQKLKDKVS
jgi:NAD(P)H-dependent FMN reductase